MEPPNVSRAWADRSADFVIDAEACQVSKYYRHQNIEANDVTARSVNIQRLLYALFFRSVECKYYN